MNTRTLSWSLSAAVVASALTAFVLRSDARAQEGASDAEKGWMDKLAVIAAYAQAATPNEYHEQLCETVGHWTFEATTHLGPVSETSKGTAEFEALLGGRYVMQRTKGEMLRGEFEGLGINGYDNVAREFFTFWIDSWSTGIYVLRGPAPKEGEPLVLKGEACDAMSPKGRPWRMVQTWPSADEFKVEVFDTIPQDGVPTDMKVADLHYVRSR